jgi:hypothetical protein
MCHAALLILFMSSMMRRPDAASAANLPAQPANNGRPFFFLHRRNFDIAGQSPLDPQFRVSFCQDGPDW